VVLRFIFVVVLLFLAIVIDDMVQHGSIIFFFGLNIQRKNIKKSRYIHVKYNLLKKTQTSLFNNRVYNVAPSDELASSFNPGASHVAPYHQ
jgi:hypothetical protein